MKRSQGNKETTRRLGKGQKLRMLRPVDLTNGSLNVGEKVQN